MKPESLRELKQLWVIADYYYGKSKGLDDQRTYGEVWSKFTVGNPGPDDFRTLILSAHLDSAAARYAIIHEHLDPDLYGEAYQKDKGEWIFPDEYLHVYLRDATRHPEPDDNDKECYRKRQIHISGIPIAHSYEVIKHNRDELGQRFMAMARTLADLTEWLANTENDWIMRIKEREAQ